ncbi:MAG: shikimate dehydrogenase [Nitrososphaerota archaeon]|nr:shikimate dehydrogenase [Nitrososphaerota archaeon]
MPDRYVLVGGNVSSSPTPRMMNAAIEALGLDAVYEASNVPAAELGKAFAALAESGASGANVTIPHKIAITRFLDSLEGAAAETGAVNTLKRDGDGYTGHNTDVDGILGPLISRGRARVGRAAVVGTGGAARAFCGAMHALGCAEIVVISRDPIRAEGFMSSMRAAFPATRTEFASAENVRASAPEILFNASPAGAGGIPLPAGVTAFFEARPLVFDAVYAPVETDLTRRARSFGCEVIYGHEMLLYQASRSLEIWTGRTPPLGVMKSVLLRTLGVSAD